MKWKLLSIIFIVSILCSSCDLIRKILNKPTSEDIAQMRVRMQEIEKLKEQARLDSIRLDSIRIAAEIYQQKIKTDSIAALEELTRREVNMRSISQMNTVILSNLEYRYYSVIGSFKNKSNAQSLSSKAKAAGYDALLISLRSGTILVAVNPVNTAAELVDARSRLLKENFCPEDAWVLVNDKSAENK